MLICRSFFGDMFFEEPSFAQVTDAPVFRARSFALHAYFPHGLDTTISAMCAEATFVGMIHRKGGIDSMS